jgi:hypothetical protein
MYIVQEMIHSKILITFILCIIYVAPIFSPPQDSPQAILSNWRRFNSSASYKNMKPMYHMWSP